MSPAPQPPQPSNPPPSLAAAEAPPATDHQTSISKHPHFPTPKLRLELRDLLHNSTDVFLEHFKSSKDLPHLVATVLRLLYTVDSPHENQNASHQQPTSTTRPAPTEPKIPGTRSVTLIVRDMDGVAYTTGNDLDDDHKEIHLSLGYITHVARGAKDSIRHELLGVVAHELVHCFQWAARGTCPGGLIEGMADWVRLNAGYVPPHWKKDANGDWDRGYQNTGYFLDWIEQTKGSGSMYRLNQALRDDEYDESKFWTRLFGANVDVLYNQYKKALKHEGDARSAKGDVSAKFGDPNKKMEIRVKHSSDDSSDNGPGAQDSS